MAADGADDDLLVEGETCWRRSRCERLGVLVDGADYYRALVEACEGARRSIVATGWALHPEVRLLRGPDHEELTFGDLLRRCLERNPDLHVYLLPWDFLPFHILHTRLGRFPEPDFPQHERLHLQLDARHAAGASHHQKVIAIDSRLAFVGGIDITAERWDTSEHRHRDARRDDKSGSWHDLMLLVDGPVAADFAEMLCRRWQDCGGAAMENLHGDADWPAGVPVAARDVVAAVSRTVGRDGEEIAEVEAWYREAARRAERRIYIENQYFSDPGFIRLLGERLQEDAGPEIVAVLPRHSSGFVERLTVDVVRSRLLRYLQRRDLHGRLRVFSPLDDEGGDIFVHAKVCIVDDRWASIGSANVSQRSFGLDTEANCSLAVGHDPCLRRLRQRLLAEHLGRPVDEVAAAEERDDSLCAVVDELDRDQGRRLRPLGPQHARVLEWLLPDDDALELGDPIDPRSLRAATTPEHRLGRLWDPMVRGLIGLVLVVVAVLVGRATGHSARVLDAVAQLHGLVEPLWGPIQVIVLSALLVAVRLPAGLAALVAGWWSGWWQGFFFAWIGAPLGALVLYGLGRVAPRRLLGLLAGARMGPLRREFGRTPPWSIVLALLLLLASLPVVALASGHARVRVRLFLLGTVVGIVPSCLVHAALGDMLVAAASAASWALLAWMLLLILLWGGLAWLLRRMGRMHVD